MNGVAQYITRNSNMVDYSGTKATIKENDFDGQTADEIIQYALFGEVVFG